MATHINLPCENVIAGSEVAADEFRGLKNKSKQRNALDVDGKSLELFWERPQLRQKSSPQVVGVGVGWRSAL